MSWAELVAAAEAVRDAAIERSPGLASRRLTGIGWATVDRERAQAELDGALARDPAAPLLAGWMAIDRDRDLGASVSLRTAAGATSSVWTPSLIVLEPDTEGRIAAYLARFGEGVGAVYLGSGRPGRPGNGEILRGGPAWGPHVIVLDGPA